MSKHAKSEKAKQPESSMNLFVYKMLKTNIPLFTTKMWYWVVRLFLLILIILILPKF